MDLTNEASVENDPKLKPWKMFLLLPPTTDEHLVTP